MSNPPRIKINNHIIEVGPSDFYCMGATKDDNIVITDSLGKIQRRIDINGQIDFPTANKIEKSDLDSMEIPDSYELPLVLRSDGGDLLFSNKSDRNIEVIPENLEDGVYKFNNRKNSQGQFTRLPPEINTGNNAYRSDKYTLTVGNSDEKSKIIVEIPKLLEDQDEEENDSDAPVTPDGDSIIDDDEDQEDITDRVTTNEYEVIDDKELCEHICRVGEVRLLDFDKYNYDSYIESGKGKGRVSIEDLNTVTTKIDNCTGIKNKAGFAKKVPTDCLVRHALNTLVVKEAIKQHSRPEKTSEDQNGVFRIVIDKIRKSFDLSNDQIYVGSDASEDTVPVNYIVNLLENLEKGKKSIKQGESNNSLRTPTVANIDNIIKQKLSDHLEIDKDDIDLDSDYNPMNVSNAKGDDYGRSDGEDTDSNPNNHKTELIDLGNIAEKVKSAESLAQYLENGILADEREWIENNFDVQVSDFVRILRLATKISDLSDASKISGTISRIESEEIKQIVDTFAVGEILDLYQDNQSNINTLSEILQLIESYTRQRDGDIQTYKDNNYSIQDLLHFLEPNSPETRCSSCKCIEESALKIDEVRQQYSELDGSEQDELDDNSNVEKDYESSSVDDDNEYVSEKKDIDIKSEITENIIDKNMNISRDTIMENLRKLGDIRYSKVRKVMIESNSGMEIMSKQKWGKNDFSVEDPDFKRLLNTLMYVSIINKSDNKSARLSEIPDEVELVNEISVGEIDVNNPQSVEGLPKIISDQLIMNNFEDDEEDESNENTSEQSEFDPQNFEDNSEDNTSEDSDKYEQMKEFDSAKQFMKYGRVIEIKNELSSRGDYSDVKFGDMVIDEELDHNKFVSLIDDISKGDNVGTVFDTVANHGTEGYLDNLNEDAEKLYNTCAIAKIVGTSEANSLDKNIETLSNVHYKDAKRSIELVGDYNLYEFIVAFVRDDMSTTDLECRVLSENLRKYRQLFEEADNESENSEVGGFEFGDEIENDEEVAAPTNDGGFGL